MRRAAMTALLATIAMAGCGSDATNPYAARPFKCDAGEVVVVTTPPNLTCVSADGGTETDASAD